MQLVRFDTEDGLRLNGLLVSAGSDLTVIHVHGRGGNFYENSFLRRMYQEYPRFRINILAFNNRGHSSYVEAYRSGEVAYVGSAVEGFEESLLDLQAATAFARSIGSRIVLQGHSLGCEKVMYYGLNREHSLPLVMLSPSDGYRLQTVYRDPETVEGQILRLKSTYSLRGLEIVPPEEYGIRCGGLYYHVPITAQALVDLLTGPAFRLLRRGYQLDERLQNKCYAYLGDEDPLQIDGTQAMREVILERFIDAHVEIYPQGDHQLRGAMPEVLESIAEWIIHNA
jgi:pimeloyl-ACP methyl ester carboxylesterase